ncbi:trace amine-associated receptor 4-like isoform X2 [Linepithema humile]|uniref:trace amine-associated receptor 4-like isoform X2 n=1 Tax=Linepithema humile TaxID=83485 RepID=UPI00062312A4|nr:PREDICTED: trace amine-associated receptor 4-like [Linepithema humile]
MLNFIKYAIQSKQFTHRYWEDEYDIRENKCRRKYYGKNYNIDDIQTEKISATQHAYNVLNFTIPNTTMVYSSMLEESTEIINESTTQNASISYQSVNSMLYLYVTPALILFCVISILVNINVIISAFWIKRPLSPTLHISLSLSGADAFTSCALGIGLVMNSFIPHGLEIELEGMNCFLLALEAVRLGGVIITVFHLMVLAINHYLGILKPLHYLSIMTHRNITILLVLLWVLPISFFVLYFSLIEDDGFQSEECKKNMFLVHRQFRILFSSLFFGPFVVMTCIYIHIFYIVKRHQAMRLRFCGAESFIRVNTSEVTRNNNRRMARNIKAINTTLYILGSFIIGWMPGVIMFMLFCEDCVWQLKNVISMNIAFIIYTIINFLIILKTLVNPIIYAARMHEIKIAKRRMCDALCKCPTLINFNNLGISMIYSSESRNSQTRNGTSPLSHNMSVRRARNGSTYICVNYNAQEYGNTIV